MIILYTDRTIRIFNWVANNLNVTITNTPQSSHIGYNNPFQESGKFILDQSWELPDQVRPDNIFFFLFHQFDQKNFKNNLLDLFNTHC